MNCDRCLVAWSNAFGSCLLLLLSSQKLGTVCKAGRWWNVCSANLQCVNKVFIDSVGTIISLYLTPRVTKHVSELQLYGNTCEMIRVVLRVNTTKLSEIFNRLMNCIHAFKCSLTHFLAMLSLLDIIFTTDWRWMVDGNERWQSWGISF